MSLKYDVELAPVENNLRDLDKQLLRFKPDIVFNLLEEFRGEGVYDFHVVSFLESLGIRYTGCNPRALAVSRNKVWVAQIAQGFDIPTPVTKALPARRSSFANLHLKYPLFIKFNREHASLGLTSTNLVKSPAELSSVVNRLGKCFPGEILAQQFIPGQEVSVGVWGNSTGKGLAPWHLHLPSENHFATEKVKFSSVFRKQLGIRAGRFRGAAGNKLIKDSEKLFRCLDMSGYARFDYRVDTNGEAFLIDVNANPNLAQTEDFACSAKFGGWEYLRTIERILELACKYQPCL